MKTRATSFLLATLAVVSLILPAFAAVSEMPGQELLEEPPAQTAETEEEESAIRLDGENVPNVEYEFQNSVCYVTVSSFVSMLDAEAVVEEENGTVCVNAVTVTGVIPVEPEAEAETEYVPSDEEAEALEPTQEDDAEGIANVVTADLNVTATAGACYFVANGRHLYVKDGLIEVNGHVAAPVRQLAQVFNLTVGFDTDSGQVLLSHQEGAEPYLADADYDDDVLYWLSHIIFTESGNQPLEGKIAVGNVVMNRVNDPRFPNSVYDVLFQKNQFTPAATGSIYREPNWESVLAAKLVMDGAEVTDALFFNGVKARAPRGRTYVTTIGNHAFYK